MGTLNAFADNVYSQNGEDGVLAEILARLGIEAGYFVEFGAWDGRHLSNTFRLAESGWQGLYIESDSARFGALQANIAPFEGRVGALNSRVRPQGDGSLDELLASKHVPAEFELLSIDIDSEDWNVWLRLSGHRPLVVVLEINSSLPPGIVQTHRGAAVQGCSFSAAVALARAKGYHVVCHTGNVVMVREDRVAQLDLPAEELEFPELLFDYSWVLRSARAASEAAPARSGLLRRARAVLGRRRASLRGRAARP